MSKPVYYFIDIQIANPKGMKPYQEKVALTFEKYGGKRIIFGGLVEPLASKPDGIIVMVRFESMEKAKAWHNSPEYQELISIREENAISKDFFVEGIE